ncbi:GIY-YIG nuclease family protein [Oricola indica]|jgi:putative endonuclease|uniref:GIY-YIG nuclease family protein n=1 Tax=Oricola indica TaxID=2872591 RepID=UPI001CBF847C|nr:GIY-YIG nuclease family protein [Oricola indica]
MGGYVYMLASKKGGTIYIGVTADLSQRVCDHKQRINKKDFASQYGAFRLVWYEEYDDITDAIQREKSLKRWRRQWKIELIESMNPDWRELYGGMGW